MSENNEKGPSSTAMEMTFHRAIESSKDEDERIIYDPYAFRFLSPDLRKFLEAIVKGNEKAKAKMDTMNSLFPGTQNSIIARVRFFDDCLKISVDEGIRQVVILGAGYDTRAYRMKGLEEKVKVFEVDLEATQMVKIEKIKEIFDSLPEHVEYVAVDIGTEKLFNRLQEHGYDPSKKTFFIMEGLIYYLPPKGVDNLLSLIVQNSGQDSRIVFDYFPESLVDETCEQIVGKRIIQRVKQYGEPFKFGIKEGMVEKFLLQRGFKQIQDLTSEEYKEVYFRGKNEGREVCSLYSFAYAVVE